MKYICQRYNLPDHWYPKDLQRKARVEEALSWFPMNLRSQAFLFAVSLFSCKTHALFAINDLTTSFKHNYTFM